MAENTPQATPKAKEPTEKEVKAQLKKEGFHDCTRVRLVRGDNNNIAKFGEKVNDIQAMHQSNIDEYNAQQVNTGMFIKKDGAKYKLVDVKVPGRKVPLKMFMEEK